MTVASEPTMGIGELAEASGRSTHTLRYYESLGLIPDVERTEAGHRRYRSDHVNWLNLLDRLKASGMSMQRMQEYTALVQRGAETLAERAALLRRHGREIEQRIRELQSCRRVVQAKIEFYDRGAEDPDRVWALIEQEMCTLRECMDAYERDGDIG